MASPGRRTTATITAIYTLRMLGFFLIVPVFALYAENLRGSTPFLIGCAIGMYGATQTLLQIPFGWWSDRFGRKKIITIGLVIFAIGSAIASASHSIWGVIIGRAIQGGGAIASPLMALAADATRPEERTKIMATLGIAIGLSFSFALLIGPVLNHWIGVDGIFMLTAFLSLVAVAALWGLVPNPTVVRSHNDLQPILTEFGRALRHSELLRLNVGIFTLHCIITSLFLALPFRLKALIGPQTSAHTPFYAIVLISSLLLMLPFVILGEKKRQLKTFLVSAIVVLGLSELVFYFFGGKLIFLLFGAILFFCAFNLLEALLPSLISKIAPAATKGTSMGIFSSCQFFGAFVGGIVGGWLYAHAGLESIYLFSSLACLLWALVAVTMKAPPYHTSVILNFASLAPERWPEVISQLKTIAGIEETVVFGKEQVAYLKVDKQKLDKPALEALQNSL